MHVSRIYDLENPESEHNLTSLILMMEVGRPVNIVLPNGQVTVGYIDEINPVSQRLVELVVEIDDAYETLYYVDHDRELIGQVWRSRSA